MIKKCISSLTRLFKPCHHIQPLFRGVKSYHGHVQRFAHGFGLMSVVAAEGVNEIGRSIYVNELSNS